MRTLLRWIPPGERDVPETAASVAAADLPDLPGFDMDAGLTRLGGNRDVYRKILASFGRGNREMAAEIRAALAAGDVETATRHAHSLSGAGGNLGAVELAAAAKAAEASEGDTAAFDTLVAELEKTLTALSPLLEETADEAGDREIDTARAAKLVAEIAALLTDDLAAAMDRTGELGELLAGTAAFSAFRELARRMDAFDTEGAGDALRSVEAALES